MLLLHPSSPPTLARRLGAAARRALAWLLVAALAAPAAPAFAALPSLGDASELTVAQERRLGDQIAREIYRDPDYIDDAVLSEYLQSIFDPLLAASRLRGDLAPEFDEHYAWRLLLIRDRSVNAFALPGAYFGVNLGLIGVVASRDELASVLAHEMSHVTQRHIARMFAQQSKQTPLLLAALLIGVLAAGRSADAANAAIMGSQALAVQSQLNFSRDMEREADRVGYGVMAQAGFDTRGFVTMFEKLQTASRLNDNGSYPYLRSHPLTTERIADMQLRQQLDNKGPIRVVTVPQHAMLSARARLLADPSVDVLRNAITEAQLNANAPVNPARQAGTLYAATMAAMRLREFPRAREFADKLETVVASDPVAARLARLLQVELDLAAGDARQAVGRLGPSPKTRPELFLSAQAHAALGDSAAVLSDLQSWVAAHPNDGPAWQWLAGAYTATGEPLRGLRAEAEVQVLRLDYAAAIDRFRAAQELIRRGGAGANRQDYIDATIIDTRLRDVQSLLREQRLERSID